MIYDITILISKDTPVWTGDKEVKIYRDRSIAAGADYNVSLLEIGVHTGTHMDAPFHVIDAGRTVDQIALEQLIGPAQVVAVPPEIEVIDAGFLSNCGLAAGVQRVLFKTRNSKFWNDQPLRFREDFVGVDTSGVCWLIEKGVILAGIDWFSISPMQDLKNPHEILLRGGAVILENLDLRKVPAGSYELICLPLKLMGTDGAPVRAILRS
ncbi:cyclase family protein [Pelolinea submarina]|uniref:Kynurenine formamidase n=1 Tax=Pelolinea submarina TaxID=913107 RepID=A0A347ZTY7_9CHLR|nr:cyclase family protein [Pelolinea submarina]REG10648.1 kynurenine formamidase [Pelolinea submarina]BBB48768.1 arylformamidase [Pelolinea submarina]